MRVVGGTAKGTKLLTVPGDTTRPILDRVKTSLFDILRPEIAGIRMLDMFAGSGAVGIEALSQGAKHVVFLDIARKASETIKKNLTKTHLEDSAEVKNMDAFRYIRNTERTFDLIYIAPPQYEGIWLESLKKIAESPDKITENGQVIVQIDPKEHEEIGFETLREADRRVYGSTMLLFFKHL